MVDKEVQNKLSQQIRCQRSVATTQGSVTKPAWKVTIRRILAFLIDGAILKVCGFLITVIYGQDLIFLGDDGWWVGVVTMFIYFGVFDSVILGGRTLGKRIVGIEVVSLGGMQIGLLTALLRFSPFGIILTIFLFFNRSDQYSLIACGFGLLATLILLAIIIFGLFHPYRRSLHDLLLDTVVVRHNESFVVKVVSIRRPLMIFAIAALVIGGTEVGLNLHLVMSQKGRKLSAMSEMLASRKDIENPSVRSLLRLSKKKGLVKTVEVSAFMPGEGGRIMKHDEAAIIAEGIRRQISMMRAAPGDTQRIKILLRSGYTFGLGGIMFEYAFEFPYSRQIAPLQERHVR